MGIFQVEIVIHQLAERIEEFLRTSPWRTDIQGFARGQFAPGNEEMQLASLVQDLLGKFVDRVVVRMADPQAVELAGLQAGERSRFKAVDDPLFHLLGNELAKRQNPGDVMVFFPLKLIDELPCLLGIPADDRRRRIPEDTLGVPRAAEVIAGPGGGEITHGAISLSDSVMEELYEHELIRGRGARPVDG